MRLFILLAVVLAISFVTFLAIHHTNSMWPMAVFAVSFVGGSIMPQVFGYGVKENSDE